MPIPHIQKLKFSFEGPTLPTHVWCCQKKCLRKKLLLTSQRFACMLSRYIHVVAFLSSFFSSKFYSSCFTMLSCLIPFCVLCILFQHHSQALSLVSCLSRCLFKRLLFYPSICTVSHTTHIIRYAHLTFRRKR